MMIRHPCHFILISTHKYCLGFYIPVSCDDTAPMLFHTHFKHKYCLGFYIPVSYDDTAPMSFHTHFKHKYCLGFYIPDSCGEITSLLTNKTGPRLLIGLYSHVSHIYMD